MDGRALIPPHYIKRAYQLAEHPEVPEKFPSKGGDIELAYVQTHKRKILALKKNQSAEDETRRSRSQEATAPPDCKAFVAVMASVREECSKQGLAPLYHYTLPPVAPFILKGGFRMSTQGQGDRGVYFSTLGPASYGLGTPDYEKNIIIDCFGK